MLNQVRKNCKTKTIHMSFRNTLEEGNLYNEIMRRATLIIPILQLFVKNTAKKVLKKISFY